jgi:hypothetical protein
MAWPVFLSGMPGQWVFNGLETTLCSPSQLCLVPSNSAGRGDGKGLTVAQLNDIHEAGVLAEPFPWVGDRSTGIS